MRDAFINTIYDIAKQDPEVVLMLGDIGAFLLQKFKEEMPNQLLNAGIAEANMIGVAAGLAMSGQKPFVYSITPFVTARPYEQVKDDVAYPKLNVKLIGVGAGISYTPYGPTHHSIDDISLMRTLPNMMVVSPADSVEAAEALRAFHQYVGPAYLRLALTVPPLDLQGAVRPEFKLGTANTLKEGNDITLIATGEVVRHALLAAFELEKEGVGARVINMHTIKPLDREAVIKAATETKAIISIEEHSIYGGLGSAISEVLAESGAKVTLKRIGLPDVFAEDYGGREYLLSQYGISVEAIVENARILLKK